MKALRLVRIGRPLELCDVPIPQPGPEDALVRVKAAGICHSDAHYRAGVSPVEALPLTLGHEVAGVVEAIGSAVHDLTPGDRVCLHYLTTCGHCEWCAQGHEQFCPAAKMIGKHRDGGYAEFISIPARNLLRLPDEISFEQGAIMMCSSATSFHALTKARLRPGETLAVFGVGGLGISAIQLAKAFEAAPVFAVDVQPAKLKLAEGFGALPVNAAKVNPVEELLELTSGQGVDVALELIGLPQTMRQAVQCLAKQGRAALAGITDKSFPIAPYQELLNKEAEIIGVSDHLASELPRLLELAVAGKLDLSKAIARQVPLAADAVNRALDELQSFGPTVRTVINPGGK